MPVRLQGSTRRRFLRHRSRQSGEIVERLRQNLGLVGARMEERQGQRLDL